MKGGMERVEERQELVGMMQQCRDCGPCGSVRGGGCSCTANVTWKNASMSPPSGRHQKYWLLLCNNTLMFH